MSPTVEKLLREALELPEDVRVDLAAALLESVDHEQPDPDVDDAWKQEAKRRLAEVRSGAVNPVPWEDARAQIFGPSDAPKDR